jgi:hypothetical protein
MQNGGWSPFLIGGTLGGTLGGNLGGKLPTLVASVLRA